MAQEVQFRPKTSDIPTQPGVYRFLDSTGRVLYVGKAKNLRARLSSYFGPLDSLHERTRRMVTSASDVIWVIVATEFEALQLEFTWIKQFHPPFNVRFKDDKSYPYLAISFGEEVPRVFITRNHGIKGVKYFGPFTQAWAIRETLDTLLRVYPVRTCSAGIFDRAKRTNRPCLLGDIGKCAAPCVDRISKPDHKKLAKQFGDFVANGSTREVHALRRQMLQASEREQFELAAKFRDGADALEAVLAKSSVVFNDETDADVFSIADDELVAAVSLFKVRGGRVRGVQGWVVDKELDRKPEELVEYLLQAAYADANTNEGTEVPKEVLVPLLPVDPKAMSEWLSGLRGSKVSIRVPQRGDKAALSETALKNAKHALMLYKNRRTADFSARAQALSNLQLALGMQQAPLRIECFDISHLSGTAVVASMVVFEDGLPRKNQYRKFSIESTTDDTDSIYQTLMRRLKYLVQVDAELENKFSYRPSLLLIDGGKPQVAAAKRALDDSGIQDIAVVGIAKRLEELWLPDLDFPVILPRASDELFLVQRIRDEAHRFAITYQRAKRRSALTTELLEIPGLGEKRAGALLRRFGSTKRLRLATVDEIADVAGIGATLAGEIVRALNSQTN